ncbi:MAG: carbohydrate ABC transporter permease [Pseudomonadota bacterium]|nr:carbohydrate ABC transporter permease [Pseudomonadota bacterium]
MATDLEPPRAIGAPSRRLTDQQPQRPRKWNSRRLVLHIGLIVVVVIMLYPLIWMAASSLKPTNEIFSEAGLLPKTWRFDNYSVGWRGVGNTFSIYFENSLLISAAATLGNVISCSFAAYAFACLEFSFKRTAFVLMLGTMMLPGHVTLIPQYVLFNHLHWVNTFYPLTIPHFFGVDAFFIFLMVQFIRSLPKDLYEAAWLDGCGPGRIYFYIVLPLLRPALVTTVIFSFVWTYNDFFKQLIYLDDSTLFTVPLGLRQFLDSTGQSAWGPMLAMSTLALLPALVLFATFQRLIVEGIATTGLKE